VGQPLPSEQDEPCSSRKATSGNPAAALSARSLWPRRAQDDPESRDDFSPRSCSRLGAWLRIQRPRRCSRQRGRPEEAESSRILPSQRASRFVSWERGRSSRIHHRDGVGGHGAERHVDERLRESRTRLDEIKVRGPREHLACNGLDWLVDQNGFAQSFPNLTHEHIARKRLVHEKSSLEKIAIGFVRLEISRNIHDLQFGV
jgi:hypothetical protein